VINADRYTRRAVNRMLR